MATLELEDIQGIVIRGYANLTAACFVLLQIEDTEGARKWLAEFSQRVTPGSERPERRAAHIAFTFAGLEALGLGEEPLRGFSEDFQAGMTTDHKQRILGDTEESAPGYRRRHARGPAPTRPRRAGKAPAACRRDR